MLRTRAIATRRSGRLCLALVVGAAACSSSVPATSDGKVADTATTDSSSYANDGAKSGARLKITYWAFADGTRSWNAFYDSQRKENCFIAGPWPDGGYYCSPGGASVNYADAQCKTPIGMVYSATCPQPAPSYLAEYGYTSCVWGPQHLYLRGAKINQTQYYYKNNDGTCNTTPVTATGYDFYAAGAEIAPSNLAAITIGQPTGTGTLTQRFATSADGMVMPWSVHDAGLADDCYPSSYDPSGTSAVCVPSDSAYAYYLHDMTCTVPEIQQQKGCTPPQSAGYSPDNSCPADPPKYFAMGAKVSNTPLFYDNAGTCTSTTGATTYDYYTTTNQLTIQTLTRAPDNLPSHRIQLIHDTTSDGLRVRDWSLWDSQQNVECYPTTLPDGSTRCYPYAGYVATYYLAGCTQTVDVAEVYTGPSNCGPPTVPKLASKYISPPAGSCAYSQEIHPVGAAYTGTVYTNYGTCTAYTPTTTKLYSIGAAVDPATFASATIVTDQ